MTSRRQVVDDLMRNNNPERMGLLDWPWGDTLNLWAEEQGYPKDDDGKPLMPVDVFDFDIWFAPPWFDQMPLRDVNEVLEETDEWRIARNGAGGVLKHWKNKSGAPEHVDFHMTTRQIWEEHYRPHLVAVDTTRVNVEENKKELERRQAQDVWTFFGQTLFVECMRGSMGDVCMLETLLVDPDWVHDFNRVYTDMYKALFKFQIDEAGRPDGIWLFDDLGYRNGLMFSPAILEKLLVPYYKELTDFFHDEYDLPVLLHSCGGITDALPLLVQAGFDGINPMEVKAGCDLFKFAEDYGDDLVFLGGVDARVFESGDRELIRKEVIRVVNGMKERGGRLVFGSDHSLSPRVRYDDFQYAVEVFQDHMWY